MKAYKLVRLKKDGNIYSLFINKKEPLVTGEWLPAKDYPTDGYAHRPGWHCTLKPEAPHLSKKGRVWVEVDVDDFKFFKRPESQGGEWVLAQRMKINRLLLDI